MTNREIIVRVLALTTGQQEAHVAEIIKQFLHHHPAAYHPKLNEPAPDGLLEELLAERQGIMHELIRGRHAVMSGRSELSEFFGLVGGAAAKPVPYYENRKEGEE